MGYKYQETTEELEELYQIYSTAIKKIAKGAQEYTIADRTFKRADLTMLELLRKDVNAELRKKQHGGGIRLQRGIPIRKK